MSYAAAHTVLPDVLARAAVYSWLVDHKRDERTGNARCSGTNQGVVMIVARGISAPTT